MDSFINDDEDDENGAHLSDLSSDDAIEQQRARTLKLAKKEIANKKLQNPIMQARLACNSHTTSTGHGPTTSKKTPPPPHPPLPPTHPSPPWTKPSSPPPANSSSSTSSSRGSSPPPQDPHLLPIQNHPRHPRDLRRHPAQLALLPHRRLRAPRVPRRANLLLQ